MASDPTSSSGSSSSSGFGGSFGISQSIGSDIGGAVSDLFAAEGYKYKQQGALIEKGMYEESASWARQNEQYVDLSTSIKQMQQQREVELSMGGTGAAVSHAGFEESGSALDILRDSAQQGALASQVLGFQGQITKTGYEEQAKALDAQAQAAQVSADAAAEAEKGSKWASLIKGATAVAGVALAIPTGGTSLMATVGSLGSMFTPSGQ